MRAAITHFGAKAVKKLPFGEDYRHINSLKYHQQIREALESSINEEGFSGIFELKANLQDVTTQMTLNDAFDDTVCDNFDELTRDINASISELSETDLSRIAELEKALKKLDDKIAELMSFFKAVLEAPSSAWQKAMRDDYLATAAGSTDTKDFAEFCLQQASYLPTEYAVAPGDRFPGSTLYRHGDFAHFQPCQAPYHSLLSDKPGALASSAPKKLSPAADKITLQAFLRMLAESGATSVVELGRNPERLDYKTVSDGGRYTSKFISKISLFIVTDTVTGKATSIKFNHFAVEDQHPLNASDDDLKRLAYVYRDYTQGTLLIHCDSGVGRTGQVVTTFQFLDYLTNHPTLALAVENMITGNVDEDNAAELIEKLYSALIETLSAARKIRYTVEKEAQFLAALTLALQLIAIQKGYHTEAQLNAVREQLGVALIPHGSAIFDADDAQSETAPSPTTDSHGASPVTQRRHHVAHLRSEVAAAAANASGPSTPNSATSLPHVPSVVATTAARQARLPDVFDDESGTDSFPSGRVDSFTRGPSMRAGLFSRDANPHPANQASHRGSFLTAAAGAAAASSGPATDWRPTQPQESRGLALRFARIPSAAAANAVPANEKGTQTEEHPRANP